MDILLATRTVRLYIPSLSPTANPYTSGPQGTLTFPLNFRPIPPQTSTNHTTTPNQHLSAATRACLEDYGSIIPTSGPSPIATSFSHFTSSSSPAHHQQSPSDPERTATQQTTTSTNINALLTRLSASGGNGISSCSISGSDLPPGAERPEAYVGPATGAYAHDDEMGVDAATGWGWYWRVRRGFPELEGELDGELDQLEIEELELLQGKGEAETEAEGEE